MASITANIWKIPTSFPLACSVSSVVPHSQLLKGSSTWMARKRRESTGLKINSSSFPPNQPLPGSLIPTAAPQSPPNSGTKLWNQSWFFLLPISSTNPSPSPVSFFFYSTFTGFLSFHVYHHLSRSDSYTSSEAGKSLPTHLPLPGSTTSVHCITQLWPYPQPAVQQNPITCSMLHSPCLAHCLLKKSLHLFIEWRGELSSA